MINYLHLLLLLAFPAAGAQPQATTAQQGQPHVIEAAAKEETQQPEQQPARQQEGFYEQLVSAAVSLTHDHVVYDPAYYAIPYPNGDVPKGKGVCTDVVIRAYRKVGIDLQKEVHEDMRANFGRYPKNWGLSRPDKNIDHRRVPNLMTFFGRYGETLPLSQKPADYKPGDIVCWNLGGPVTHIGLVVNKKSRDGKRYQIVHNIGGGQVMEDMLFDFKIIGHYRYNPQ